MIRDFWVKNYLSIRHKQELNFVAKGAASELVTEVTDGVYLYKLGILYGANASGKSNMLLALNEVFRLLVESNADASQRIGGYVPFALTANEPTQMHVSFYLGSTRMWSSPPAIFSARVCITTPTNPSRYSMSEPSWVRTCKRRSNSVPA